MEVISKLEVKIEEIDSIAFNQNVLKLVEVDKDINFVEFEKDYLNQYSPKYIYAKLPIEELENIHYLEQNGFEFMETQLQLFKRLTEMFDNSAFSGKIHAEQVTDINDLEEIYKVSDATFDSIDRIFIDEKLSVDIAQKRYHLYIENSFKKENQRLDKLIDLETGKIIGFHTLLYKDNKSITILLGGILPEYQKSGANYALDYFVYNELFKSGHKNITTHISAKNIKIMNYLTKVLSFKVKESFVVLRKVY